MTLLIVNDDSIVADTMKEEMDLAQYGIHEAFVAYDAQAAKEIIKEQEIDILLCDIEMPGENGLELLRWVRKEEREIECIFLTCHAKFNYAQEAISLQCQDYILTPAKYEDIGRVIQNVADRIQVRRKEQLYTEYGRHYFKKDQKTGDEGENVKLKPQEVVEMVAAYIMEHIAESDLSVENIADRFHFHPVYLNRIFRKEKQVSIGQFIINERMKLAALLLKEGCCSVTEVAERVGYAHYTNFYNMFKKTYKISPVQYVEEHVGGKGEKGGKMLS